MKKWAFLCAVAVSLAVIGCGGSANNAAGGNNGSNAGGTGRADSATITIPKQQIGLVYNAFLTGPARTEGELFMNVENASIYDSVNKVQFDRLQTSPLVLHLNAYTLQFATIDAGTLGINSELFDTYTLNPFSFAVEQANGFVGLNAGDPGVIQPDTTTLPQDIPIRLRTLPGRDCLLPLFLDESMFTNANGVVSFNYDLFKAINMQTTPDPATSGKVVGYLSDYIQFDLSHLAAPIRPKLMSSSKPATHFYLSGDNYAMSDDATSAQTGNFEQLTLDPSNPLDGFMAQPNTPVSNQFNFGDFPGTYDLRQADPTDLSGTSKITSLFGRWRKATDVINLGNTVFDVIVFPNTGENYSQAKPGDVIAIAHNGATITNMYAGFAYYTATSGKPMAKLYPIAGFVKGDTSGEIDYDLSAYTNSGGASTTDEPSIRHGKFSLSAGSAQPPAGFLNSGTFVVFR